MAAHEVMIDGIKVNTGIVRDKSAQMRRFSNDLYDVLQAAKQKMNDMQHNAIWLSAAGEEIIKSINQKQQMIDRQRDVLHQYCGFLDTTATRYEDTEDRRIADAVNVHGK